jgi:hypothetical protein
MLGFHQRSLRQYAESFSLPLSTEPPCYLFDDALAHVVNAGHTPLNLARWMILSGLAAK